MSQINRILQAKDEQLRQLRQAERQRVTLAAIRPEIESICDTDDRYSEQDFQHYKAQVKHV